MRLPLLAFERGLHELVAQTHRQVRVLEHDRAVCFAVKVRFVLARFDQQPSLLLFLRLALNEFENIRMPIFEALHLGRSPSLPARLHDRRDLVINPHERQRPGRNSAARQLLFGRADRGQVRASTRSELEQHRLAASETHDVLHVVFDRLNEAGRALRELIRRIGPADRLRLDVPAVISLRTFDAVLVIQPDVEPHGRVEAAVLMQQQPSQFAIKRL
ncbi:MAG: hypothetical protein FD138_4367, partial [Planctomycetota bacterium]